MARKETVVNRITSFDESWDNNHTGQEVEDFITSLLEGLDKNLIVGARFEGTKLTLEKKDSEPIEVTVVVADPTYTFNIYVYGLVLNGDYSNIKRAGDSLITLYSSGKTFHLGVALIAYTDTVGNKNNITAAQPITISYGNKSGNYTIIPTDYDKVIVDSQGVITGFTDGVDPINDIAWINVTDLFKEANEGSITASYSIEAKSGGQFKTFTGQYTLPIASIKNEVVNLKYSSDSVINNTTTAQFITDTGSADYRLQGYIIKNNGTPEVISLDNLSYNNLVSGLNQFIVRGVNKYNPEVATDYITVDIICTVGLNRAVVAVNDVKNTISNNGVSQLYKLTIYSPTGGDTISINTYVTDQAYLQESLIPESSLVKSDVVTDTSYKEITGGYIFESDYKKYMEITGGGRQYLYINIGEDQWYKFLSVIDGDATVYPESYRDMTVEALDNNLTYYANGVSLSFDQIKGCVNDVFKTKDYFPLNYNVNPNLEVSDGWIEEEGRNIFRVTAQDPNVFTTPLAINLQDQFTLEFGFKSYNISDESAPVITIGNLELRPLQLCWNVGTTSDKELDNNVFTARNSQFQENVETHVVMTFRKAARIQDENIYYPDYLDAYGTEENLTVLNNQTVNLVRIFINGVIDREFILQDAELNALKQASLQINPRGSDIDFYVLRVYNSTALTFDLIRRNYLSFLKTKDSKLAFYRANDILGVNGEISFNKCLGKYNTIVYVLPEGCKKIDGNTNDKGRFPNRAWGYQNNSPAQDGVMKKAHVSIFLNYANPETNRLYGGRMNHMQIKSQGSSAERYLIWNIGSQMDKFKNDQGKKIKSMFTPYSNLDESNRFIENASSVNYYVMPTYNKEVDTTEYQAKKFVGKVNFASSMQSHKLGALRLYDDAFKNAGNSMPTCVEGATYGSKKGSHDEPFLYFYWEANMDNDQVASCDLADIISAGAQVKFMGFNTFGPAKTDKAYMGYNDNTPEYLLVEGGENKDVAVNFRVPWHALQRTNKDENELTTDDLQTYQLTNEPTTPYDPTQSWKRLLIHDESICYNGKSGAWDVDYGLEDDAIIETEDGVTSFWKFVESAHKSLNKFREFYDYVYSHDYSFNVCTANNPDPYNSTSVDEFGNPVREDDGTVSNKWDVRKKYLVTANASPIAGYNLHQQYDLYRYEEYSGQWVPAGLSYDLDNHRWNRLNIRDMSGLSTSNIEANRNAIRAKVWGTWANAANGVISGTRATTGELANYINLNDIAFHQALVKFLSGTDNRAKNTYFQMVGPLYHTVVTAPAVYYTQEEVDEINAQHEGEEEWTPITTSDVKTPEETSFEPIETEGSQAYEDSYKLRMIGWDMDTIIVTNNNGLQTKPYNLIEASYNHDHDKYWGDAHNLFFYMFDQGYEDYIKSQLSRILTFAASSGSVTDIGSYFYQNFFDIQDNQFPAVAYNHTAKIYYENAQYIYDSGIMIQFYNNNNVSVPLSLSHGSAVACEKQFMLKRYNFLSTYALGQAGDDKYDFNDSSGDSGVQSARLVMDFVTYQDFYPTYYWGRADVIDYLAELDDSSQFQTNKYLAKAGKNYTIKLQVDKEGINNAIQHMSMYKEITITGMLNKMLTINVPRVTDFKIDNAIKDENTEYRTFFQGWADTALDQVKPTAPVLLNLTLRNMELPTEIDLSSYNKLKKVDFTGTNVTHVIFPVSGRLQTVILPSTITDFRIYNNPGIIATVNQQVDGELVQEGIVLPNPSGLKTVYINGANSGSFDVGAFCSEIASANLTSLTLRNVNIRITETTLGSLLAAPNCTISGRIVVVDSSNNMAPISFSTLSSLVNKFGNIRSESNGLYVQFTSEPIQTVKAPASVALYTVGNEITIAPIIESGNDAKIIEDATIPSGARLDISFYLRTSNDIQTSNPSTNFGSSATIDVKTGVVRLVSTPPSNANKGYVFIKVVTLADSRGKITSSTNSCEVSFTWIAPKVGDFAYEDGTFSSSFTLSKALMGLVYAVKATDANHGTAYIVGKEYSFKDSESGDYIPTYMGYTLEGTDMTAPKADQYSASVYYLRRYASNRSLLNIDDNLFTVGLSAVALNLSDSGYVNDVQYSNYGSTRMNQDEIDNYFTGKQDTLVYINAVNRYVLPKLWTFYSNSSHRSTQITDNLTAGDNDTYMIMDNNALNKVYKALYQMSIKYNDGVYDSYASYVQSGLASAVIFPYVYSMHVYQPDATSLDSQYEAGNWYMPSLCQLQRVIYMRGVSAISQSDAAYNQPDQVRLVVNGSAKAESAIFAKAFTAMNSAGGSFPACWQNLVGEAKSDATAINLNSSNSYNLVTLLNTVNYNNYGYQCTSGLTTNYTYDYGSPWPNKWVSGEMPVVGTWNNTYTDYPGTYNTWSLFAPPTMHLGIPFVEYNYVNPSL